MKTVTVVLLVVLFAGPVLADVGDEYRVRNAEIGRASCRERVLAMV